MLGIPLLQPFQGQRWAGAVTQQSLQPRPVGGLDAYRSGEVTAVGEGVDDLSPGARVACLSTIGAFAEELIVPATACFPLPAAVSFETAAILPVGYGTAWHALHDRGNTQPGETVLVLGAAGGVSLAAVQIAKALGARVIAAASSERKLAGCCAYGAHATIDYTTEDLRAAIDRHTAGKGADVIVDTVGGSQSEPAFRSIARRGRHLVVGFAAGTIPALLWNLPLLKVAAIVGVYWGDCVRYEPVRAREQMSALTAAVADGKVAPIVSGRHPLERLQEALARVSARAVIGKRIVLI